MGNTEISPSQQENWDQMTCRWAKIQQSNCYSQFYSRICMHFVIKIFWNFGWFSRAKVKSVRWKEIYGLEQHESKSFKLFLRVLIINTQAISIMQAYKKQSHFAGLQKTNLHWLVIHWLYFQHFLSLISCFLDFIIFCILYFLCIIL